MIPGNEFKEQRMPIKSYQDDKKRCLQVFPGESLTIDLGEQYFLDDLLLVGQNANILHDTCSDYNDLIF